MTRLYSIFNIFFFEWMNLFIKHSTTKLQIQLLMMFIYFCLFVVMMWWWWWWWWWWWSMFNQCSSRWTTRANKQKKEINWNQECIWAIWSGCSKHVASIYTHTNKHRKMRYKQFSSSFFFFFFFSSSVFFVTLFSKIEIFIESNII